MTKPDPLSPTRLEPTEAARGNHVYNVVFDELQQRIRQGEWLTGERLPSITQLAKELRVGTGSIREALRSLQSIGLVKISHGSGVYVIGSRPATDLSSHFQNVGNGLTVALAETRRILEPELAALAAERGTDAELEEIERLARQMEDRAQRGLDFAELDVRFHQNIAQAARNPILHRTLAGVSDLFLESRQTILMEPGAMLRTARYHLLIVDALQSRNAPLARLLMLAHMNSMLDDVLAAEARALPKESL